MFLEIKQALFIFFKIEMEYLKNPDNYKWIFDSIGTAILIPIIGFFVKRYFFDTPEKNIAKPDTEIKTDIGIFISEKNKLNVSLEKDSEKGETFEPLLNTNQTQITNTHSGTGDIVTGDKVINH